MTDDRLLKRVFVGNAAQFAVVVKTPAVKRAHEDLFVAALFGNQARTAMGADVIKGFNTFCGFRDNQRFAAHSKEKIIADVSKVSADSRNEPALSPDFLPLLLDLLMTEVPGFAVNLSAIVDSRLFGLEALGGGRRD